MKCERFRMIRSIYFGWNQCLLCGCSLELAGADIDQFAGRADEHGRTVAPEKRLWTSLRRLTVSFCLISFYTSSFRHSHLDLSFARSFPARAVAVDTHSVELNWMLVFSASVTVAAVLVFIVLQMLASNKSSSTAKLMFSKR